MEVRSRKPEDLIGLAVVGARVRAQDGYPVYLPRHDYIGFLGRPDPIAAWVAEDDEDLAPHVALNPSTSVPVTDAIRAAGSLGLAPVLDVIATSGGAIELYRREGWIEIGRVAFTFPDGQQVEELVFRGPTR